ncbi:MAG: hypothetical protein PHD47_00885 [Acholeplasmataceae bacterium]|nr:hypothetical protein [Acholeplasmataceae bacterium]
MEKKSNKGLKKLVLLLLLFIGLGASVTAGAYWASSFTAASPTDATGNLTVTIGEGDAYELQTTLAFGTQSDDTALELVPTAYKDGVSSTDTRLISIDGVWAVVPEGEYTLASATGTLSGVITGYSLGSLSEAEIDEMFSISITTNEVAIEFGSSQEVVVTVVFHTEPATKALYDVVANGTLTINITLSVVAD